MVEGGTKREGVGTKRGREMKMVEQEVRERRKEGGKRKSSNEESERTNGTTRPQRCKKDKRVEKIGIDF